MMLAATAGGYWGAKIAKRLPALALRRGIIIIGAVMTVLFFITL